MIKCQGWNKRLEGQEISEGIVGQDHSAWPPHLFQTSDPLSARNY